MTKNKEEELLSAQTFHNWKNHECTKSLIRTLKESIKAVENSIMEHVLKDDTDIKTLGILKGSHQEINGILEYILNDDSRKVFNNELLEFNNKKIKNGQD